MTTPTPCAVQRRHTARRQGGFALIVTILLMSFLVLLMVSMSALTRVETAIATNSQQAERARQNALTALNIAIGQLQSAAGPDQNITARAEILDSSPATPSVDGVKQPYWTAAWKTGSATLDDNAAGQRLTSLGGTSPTAADKVTHATWLVSRPTTTGAIDPLAGTFTSSSGAVTTLQVSDTLSPAETTQSGVNGGSATPNAVVLARGIGRKDPAAAPDATSNPGFVVAAPLVDLKANQPGFNTPQTVGQFAYWIDDEGVKAKVNIKDPTLNSGTNSVAAVADLPKNLLHFSAPQAFAAHKFLPDSLATDFRQNPKVDQVLTPQSLPFLPATTPNGFLSKNFAADLTTYSYGVLANVRLGGLKKDLTAAFEDAGTTSGANYNKLINDAVYEDRVYRAPLDTVGTVPAAAYASVDGLRWPSLYFFYNTYKATAPSGGAPISTSAVTPTGVGNPDAALRPYAIPPRGYCSATVNYGMLAPIYLGSRWDAVLSATSSDNLAVGNPQKKYTLQLNYYPQLVLYNPYTVALTSNQFSYGRSLNICGVGSKSAAVLELSVGPTATATKSYTMLNQARKGLGTYQRLTMASSYAESQTFAPGEIRVYGGGGTQNTFYPAVTGKLRSGIALASEFQLTTTTDGLLSKTYVPTIGQTADFTSASSLSDCATISQQKEVASYKDVLDQPVSMELVSGDSVTPNYRMFNIGQVVTSLSGQLVWPQQGGQGTASGMNAAGGFLQGYGMMTSPSALNYDAGSSPSITRNALTGLNISDLFNAPRLLFSYYCRKKGIQATDPADGFSNQSTVVPAFMGNSSFYNLINDSESALCSDEVYKQTTWPTYQTYRGSEVVMNAGASPYATTSWGQKSMGVDDNSLPLNRIVLAEVPVQPMLSLGQFMHLQPHYIDGALGSFTDYSRLGFGSMFIGGSFASPDLATSVTAEDKLATSMLMVGKRLALDHSFLANQTLFDGYFLSTVPPANLPASTTSPAFWTAFNAANTGTRLTDRTTPFLNTRMTPYSMQSPGPVLSELRDMDKAAANLLLNGAFNVNSTSVDAWRSLLSSLSGNDLSLWNATLGMASTFTAANLQNPIPRFWSATGNANLNTAWCGVRSLSDAEVKTLAEKIVEQVKTRGPFLSMADFLNRRLGTASALTRVGALQAAIDNTPLNTAIKANGTDVVIPSNAGYNEITATTNMVDGAGNTWNSTLGIPGYLMQQDLVQAFAPVLAARSDTFVIRTYGDTQNPATGQVVARAYCEAVVQRLPEYVDATATPAEQTPVAGSTNDKLGRRFKIISFRWLSNHDI